MRSAEFYQVFGRVRHEELLEEARYLRTLRTGRSDTRRSVSMGDLRGRLATFFGIKPSDPEWQERLFTGKAVNG